MSIKLNVLITRPKQKAQALAESLAAINIACVNQPLFDYQALADHQTSKNLLTNENIIIFVSVAAVEFAHAAFAAQNWRYKYIIAVGRATKSSLQLLGIEHVICPQQENSEGLLALPELNINFCHEPITVVRGNGGREHLAIHLTEHGANVNYLESYQRVWRTFSEDIGKQWFKHQINCIVVTSNAILEKLVQLVFEEQERNNTQQQTAYWREQCLWVVASQRIANTAKQLGLTRVVISDGASENAITTTLQQLESM
jgi:uroporphyrinogen-III synthase